VNPLLNAPVERQPHSTGGLKRSERAVLVLAALVILVLLVVAVIPGGDRAQPSFYMAAAQVIPVLILALAVNHLWRPRWSRLMLLAVVVMLVVGEFAAMLGTAYDVQEKGHTGYLIASSRLISDLLEFFAVVALGVGLIVVLWSTVFLPDVTAASDDKERVRASSD
jgi:hypothetical protein